MPGAKLLMSTKAVALSSQAAIGLAIDTACCQERGTNAPRPWRSSRTDRFPRRTQKHFAGVLEAPR
jgi:hypothetical protein